MTEAVWERFATHARRALAKRTFDLEERDWKPATANELRGVLESAKSGGRWLEALDAAIARADPNHLTVPRDVDWLRAWAEADQRSLRAAIEPFLNSRDTPEQRFAAYARVVQERGATGGLVRKEEAALAIGALFNFAAEPETLPIVRAFVYEWLERALGWTPPDGEIAHAYEHHLDFARQLHGRLERDRVPVRDMMDVGSLIFVAVRERDFWSADPPADLLRDLDARKARAAGSTPYLAACAVYRNEATYLREWIEFHRLVGCERFFLYDNRSDDDHRDVLAPYIRDGTVVLHDWEPVPPRQPEVYDDCLRRHARDARWIAFIDLDEFLFSPTGRSLREVLRDYEQWPGVGANWAMFGSSGHRQRPPGLVIENYHEVLDMLESRYIKSIVDPIQATRCLTAHHFGYRYRIAVDENHYPIHGARTRSVSSNRLRVNHYFTKSEEEAGGKLAGRGRAWDHLRRLRSANLQAASPGTTDEAILRYVPELRAAIDSNS